MVRIFNKKLGYEILIDETHPKITLYPKTYEESNPHFEIRLGGGFNFQAHIHKCRDCKAFQESFGKLTHDWFIEFNGKIWLLELGHFSSNYFENKSTFEIGEYFNGTILKLNVAKETKDRVEELIMNLKEAEVAENFEYCCILRDAIREIGD